MRKGDPNMLLTLALYIALSNLINKYLKEGYEDWAQKYQILSFIYPTHHHRQRHGGMSCPVNWLTCSPSLNYHRIEIFPSSYFVQSEVLLYPMYVYDDDDVIDWYETFLYDVIMLEAHFCAFMLYVLYEKLKCACFILLIVIVIFLFLIFIILLLLQRNNNYLYVKAYCCRAHCTYIYLCITLYFHFPPIFRKYTSEKSVIYDWDNI